MNRLKRKLIVNGVVSMLAVLFLLVLSAGAQAETWELVNTPGFGDPDNVAVIPLEVFDDDLYAGTWDSSVTPGGEIWRTADGTTWSQVGANGLGDVNNWGMWPIAVFNEKIYAASEQNTVTGAEMWESTNGTTWKQVNVDGYNDSSNTATDGAGAILDGYFYAGTRNNKTGGEVWRTANGSSWEQDNEDGFGDPNNKLVKVTAVFDGYVYAGTANDTSGTQVWRRSSDTSWTQVNTDGFGDPDNHFSQSFKVFKGNLYVGTQNHDTGAEVWRTNNGTTWIEVPQPWDAGNTFAKFGEVAPNGYLYAGTQNDATGAEVWRTDGSTWEQVNTDGFGNVANWWAFQLIGFKGRLYVGTNNEAGGEVWALSFGNIPLGSNISTDLASGVSIGFSSVSTSGSAIVDIFDAGESGVYSSEPPTNDPAGFSLLGTYYDISTNAVYTGDITITIPYEESEVVGNEEDLELFHWDGASWDVVPSTVDTVGNTITGQVSSLSIFASGSSTAGSSTPATGMNTSWLTFLAFSLTLIGGYLVLRNRFDLFRQH